MNEKIRYNLSSLIKLYKYLFTICCLLFIGNIANASYAYDSTDEEIQQAKINAMINELTDSLKASAAIDEEEVPTMETHNGPSGQEIYLADSIKKHDFNKADWKEATKGLSYNEKSVKEKTKKDKHFEHSSSSGSWFNISSGVGQAILIIIVAALLGFILFKLFNGQISNTKVSNQKTYRIEEIEDAIHETDLERYLREAIANKEYRIAIRIYYLMAIKALSEREWIKWKKDKTNNQYLFEMSARPNYTGFRDLTRLFEFAWYGEMTVDEKHFQLLDPKFKELDRKSTRLNSSH